MAQLVTSQHIYIYIYICICICICIYIYIYFLGGQTILESAGKIILSSRRGAKQFSDTFRIVLQNFSWSSSYGGLRDGGLSESEEIWGKRPFSSVFWISHVLFAPSGKGRKRQKKGEKGRFRPISRKGGQTPLKPPFLTPPFVATNLLGQVGQPAYICVVRVRIPVSPSQ